MKIKHFIALLLLIPFSAIGQLKVKEESKKLYTSEVISFPDFNADTLIVLSKKYCSKNPETFFYARNKLFNKRWSLGRAKWQDKGFNEPSTLKETADKNEIVVNAAFCYEMSRDGCIKFITITSDVIIASKEGKLKVEFTNFKYTNKNIDSPPAYVTIGGGGYTECAKWGTLEELAACTDCQNSLTPILDFVYDSCKDFTNNFHTRIMAIKQSGGDNTEKGSEEDW